MVKFGHVTVAFTSQDGNARELIGATMRAICREVGRVEAHRFVEEAEAQESYVALLALIARTVHVA